MTILMPFEAPEYADRLDNTDRRADTPRRQRDIGCDPWRGGDRRSHPRHDRRGDHDRRGEGPSQHGPRVAPPTVTRPKPPIERLQASERDRNNPTIWQALQVDPTLFVPADSRALQIRDQQRKSRHFVRPVLRVVAMVIIHLSLFIKRLLPFNVGSERALNWIGPRFVRRFASPEALAYVLRHFVIESNLVNFVARNSGADDVAEVSLRPTDANGLGDDNGLNAVARHDANIFNLIIDLGESHSADIDTTRTFDDLDFSMLTIPPFDLEPQVRRWINLDLESTLHITVAALALFMDATTAERAVNSFQLDESMLACIANLTGDPVFRTWTPVKFPNWLGMTNNVGRDLHWHIIVNEYAHERLCRMRAGRDERCVVPRPDQSDGEI